jgi:hypothetical protein
MAIQRAKLPDKLRSQILDAVFANDERDRQPLMALLLASLPRVSTIYAHIPALDPSLGGVLQAALDQQQTCAHSSVRTTGKQINLISSTFTLPQRSNQRAEQKT